MAVQVIASAYTDGPTLTAAAPIHSDVKKVNGVTVIGNGQTGSEWGPA